jgi:phenylacetic acid degradation protein PaaD
LEEKAEKCIIIYLQEKAERDVTFMHAEPDVVKRLQNDALAHHLGIELQEMRPGYARATVNVGPHLLNGVGITHGGTIFSLADVVFAAASNAHGPVAVAMDVHISFIKSTSTGETLTAEWKLQTARVSWWLRRKGGYSENHSNLALLQYSLLKMQTLARLTSRRGPSFETKKN